MFKIIPTKLAAFLATDPAAMLTSVQNWLLSIATGVGVIIAIWGGVQFFLSLRDQNPDGQQRAIWTLVAGVALAALETILTSFGVIGS